MKYIVEMPGQYIAAILSDVEKLTDFLTEVPVAMRKELEIKTTYSEYPFEILEHQNKTNLRKRHFVVLSDMKANKEHMIKLAGKFGLAVYQITEDFLGDPKNPGQDYMGKLSHEHLQEE